MAAITLSTLKDFKTKGEKFSILTCYDSSFAKLMNTAGIEVLLIGDSLGNVLQGHNSTLPVTLEDIAYHTASVRRGNTNALIMADLPFMPDPSLPKLQENSAALMRAGANLVKIEGGAWSAKGIKKLTQRGIPVCAHLGLTPQMVNSFGGYRVQGRGEAGELLIKAAKKLEKAGAAAILLECVPSELGTAVTQAVSCPVIGIGAGADTDGQVLVLHDMLGITQGKVAKFVKNFMEEASSIQEAISNYHLAVKNGSFPAEEHCFQ